MRPKTGIAIAAVLVALAVPTAAPSQTAFVTTDGRAGHSMLSVGPIALTHESRAVRLAANAGSAPGTLTTADAAVAGHVVRVSIGCVAAHAAVARSSLDAELGNCPSATRGGGENASGGGEDDAGGGGAGDDAGGGGAGAGGLCGCVLGGVLGDVASSPPRDGSGDDGDRPQDQTPGDGTGNADEGAGSIGGVAGETAASAAGGQPGDDQPQGGAGGAHGCSAFERMANVSALGPVPIWGLVLGSFLAGAFFARRRDGAGRV